MRMTHTPLNTQCTVKLVGTSVTKCDYMTSIKLPWDVD